MAVFDLGDPEAWPEPVQGVVKAIAREVAGWPELHERDEELDDEFGEDDLDDAGFPACDLPATRPEFAEDADRRLRDALVGHHLRAYHASRFLPHEVKWVRAEGMSALSPELIERRLRGAAEHYPALLCGEDSELLRHSGPLTWQGTRAARVGLLWVVAPFAIFTEQASGFVRLFGTWGGESIGWTNNDPAKGVIERFTRKSVPAIVELAVAPEEVPARRNVWPTPVGRLLGLRNSTTEWALNTSLGAARVLDVLHPENPRWPQRRR